MIAGHIIKDAEEIPVSWVYQCKMYTVKPVLRDHCHETPPVLKDHTFLAEGPTFQCK